MLCYVTGIINAPISHAERHGAARESRQTDGGAVRAERSKLHAEGEGAGPGKSEAREAATSAAAAQT